MSKDLLLIDGLSNFELLELQEELDAKEIPATVESPGALDPAATSKNFEFVSTAILVINVSIVAIKLITLWYKKKKEKNALLKPILKMQLSNGAILHFNGHGQVIKIQFPDGTLIEINPTNPDETKERLENAGEISDVVKTTLEIIKETLA
jgi:hypothetical protein